MATFGIQKLLDFLKENNYNETFSINMKHPGIICFSFRGNVINEVGEAKVFEHNQNDNFTFCNNIEELMSNLKIVLDYQLETNQAIAAFN